MIKPARNKHCRVVEPNKAGIWDILGSFDGRRWIDIGYVYRDGPLMCSPMFSDLEYEDRQWLLTQLWKISPQRPVTLCPEPVDREAWIGPDLNTQKTVDLLRSRSIKSVQYE